LIKSYGNGKHMKKSCWIVFLSLILLSSLLIFSNCTSTTGEVSSTPSLETLSDRISINEIILLTPDDIQAQSYLGLSGEKNFKIPQIKADVVLINVFSTTCPHCKKEAPNTNKLYETIEDRPDLKGQIKIIGIGAKNSLEDVALFKKEYKVPFPLFADEDMSIFDQLATTATPTMIGVKLLKDGTHSILFRKAGSIGEVPWFIDFLIDMARLDK